MNWHPRVPSHHRGGIMPRPWCLPASCVIAGSVLLCAHQVVLAQATEPIAEATGASSETPASYSHDPMAPRAQAVRTAQPIVIDRLLDELVGDLPPRVVPHPMLVPAPVEGREGRASSGTRATA